MKQGGLGEDGRGACWFVALRTPSFCLCVAIHFSEPNISHLFFICHYVESNGRPNEQRTINKGHIIISGALIDKPSPSAPFVPFLHYLLHYQALSRQSVRLNRISVTERHAVSELTMYHVVPFDRKCLVIMSGHQARWSRDWLHNYRIATTVPCL